MCIRDRPSSHSLWGCILGFSFRIPGPGWISCAGTLIMFGVGAIIATGSLKLWPVLLLAFIGAVCGDGISFWLGHHYQEKLRKMWPFSRHVGLLANGELFFTSD